MTDFFGFWSLTLAAILLYGTVIIQLAASTAARLALFALAGLWIGLQSALAASGAFGVGLALDVPLIGIMVATPILAAVIASLASQRARAALLGLPLSTVLALNGMRVLGGFFLLLALGGPPCGTFSALPAGGDIVTGVAALVLLAWPRRPLGTVVIWTLFGAADLILAVTLGTLSFNGFALQAIHAGVGSDTIQNLPWSLIPTVLVPLYLILHGIVLAQLRRPAPAPRPA